MAAINTAIRSQLFRGDRRLAAALVDDSKHIAKGDRGSHVSKIQCAVLMLEGAQIPGGELQARLYGPGTARAVLGYKKARKIINFAYQTKADDIAGKMTVRALDDEMFLAELADFFIRVRR